MKRALAAALLLCAGCINFQDAFERCHDGGACEAAGGGSGGGGGEVDAGGGGGGGVGADAGALGSLTALAKAGPVCTSGFCWEHPFPSGNSLHAVYAQEPYALIAGDNGTLLFWDGTQLRTIAATEAALGAIAVAGNQVLVGGSNVLLSHREGESAFSISDPCNGITCDTYSMWADPSLVVGVGYTGNPALFETDLVSQSAFDSFGNLGDDRYVAVDGTTSSTVLAVTARGVVQQRRGTIDWEDAGAVPLQSGQEAVGICVKSADEWVVGDTSGAAHHHYADGGWVSTPLRPGFSSFACRSGGGYVTAVQGPGYGNAFLCDDSRCTDAGHMNELINAATESSGVVWGVGFGGSIMRSANGVTSRLDDGSAAGLNGLARDDAGTLWAVGVGHLLLKRTNDGGWIEDPRHFTGANSWVGIAMTGPGTGYILTDNDGIKLLRSAGVTTPNVPIQLTDGGAYNGGLNAIAFTGDDYIVVADKGLVAHRGEDGGFVALRDPLTGQPNLNDVFSAGDGTAIAVGANGTVELIADAGINALSFGGTQSLSSAWGVSSTDFWVVGGGGAWAHFVNSSVAESDLSSTGAPWEAVGGTDNANIYAVDDQGDLHHYDGIEWAPSSIPLSSLRPYRIVNLPEGLFIIGDRSMVMRKQP